MLRLIVTESEYVYSETLTAYVLPEREIGPGNPSRSPSEGAATYNEWISAGCPGADALSEFENLVNYAVSNAPGGQGVAEYLLYVMGCKGPLDKPLPASDWSMQLLFARNTLNTMDSASILRLRNKLITKVGDNE